MVGPVLGFVLPVAVIWLLGGYHRFEWVGGNLSPLESLGVLAPICFPVAAYYLAWMNVEIEESRLSRGWPSAAGRVLSQSLEKKWIGYQGVLHILNVTYSYEIDGRAFTGERLAFAPRLLKPGATLDALVRKYQPGASIDVHYDPQFPLESVLETGDELARQRNWKVVGLFAAPFAITVLVAFIIAVRTA